MPVTLRNVSGVVLDLDGKTVDVDELVDVKGGLRKKGSPEDGVLIGTGDDARIYPSALWSVESGDDEPDDEKPAPAVKSKTEKEN